MRADPSPTERVAAGSLPLGPAFGALVVPTFCLIVLGALVRAHEAGLACPDWPLCFGELVPQMDVRVAFEWSHRALAGSVAIAFAVLSALALRRPTTPPAARRLIAVAAVLLVAQILLGALTVWKLLAAWTVTSHLVVGNAFDLALLCIALTLRDHERARTVRTSASAGIRGWLAVAAILLFVQVVLGGLVSSRFAGLSCPDWPACNGGSWFPSWHGPVGLHLLHRWNAVLLVAAVIGAGFVAQREPRLRGLAALGAVLVVVQLLVGIANVLLAIPVEVTGLHSALAAALVLCIGAAARAAWQGPGGAPAGSPRIFER